MIINTVGVHPDHHLLLHGQPGGLPHRPEDGGPIESPDDLADQTNIEYGTHPRRSTMTFFMNSRYQTYQRMWNYMNSKQPSVFVKSTEEGIANSKYAFLMESTMNEYPPRPQLQPH
ncbi:hypothetical protein KUCAC02_014506 [Chaenocephalus aceratus]|uniref:Uncharacterized protein n=1 Tax=Chaenocephalus aceratus TaxID=36190 RepID=A0ACB9WE21_CHAAC|nr:hypothetical protein KUCAC02_014506 [Chaenocephalus aceratus]